MKKTNLNSVDPGLFLSNECFLDTFMARHNNKKRFCWVLGSGASNQSGIPLGRDLAKIWIEYMMKNEPCPPRTASEKRKWAKKKFPNIVGFAFSRLANYYPYIYQIRYEKRESEGFEFLENQMRDKKPSFGYKILAQIMGFLDHNAAVTTNFDNLLPTALTIYTNTFPFVCGHEALAKFLAPHIQRPFVAKIHGDIFLNPKSCPNDIEKLPDEWKAALSIIFDLYTPIVIGFGDTTGSGGSLMSFLQKVSIKNGIFWCYREKKPGAGPAKEVQDVVGMHKGSLVPILGFDELLLQLWDRLSMGWSYRKQNLRHADMLFENRDDFFMVADKIFKSTKKSSTVNSTKKSAQSALSRLQTIRFTENNLVS